MNQGANNSLDNDGNIDPINKVHKIPLNPQFAKQIEQAKAVKNALNDATQNANLYSLNYKQLYFPYDSKTANTLSVGNPSSIGSSGITLPGTHTYETCKLNAVAHASNKSQIDFNNKNTPINSNINVLIVPGDFTIDPLLFDKTEVKTFNTIDEAQIFINNSNSASVLSIEIKMMINSPDKGATKCLPRFASLPKMSSVAIWSHSLTAKPILEHANVYIKNDILQTTLNNNRDFIVFKNMPIPITIRFIANKQTSIADFINVQIKPNDTNENLKTVNTGIQSTSMFTPTFFNYNTDTKQCTIVNGADFMYENENILFKQALNSDVSFVGLNTQGYLYQYNGANDSSANGQQINTIMYDKTNSAVTDSSYTLSIDESIPGLVMKTSKKTKKIRPITQTIVSFPKIRSKLIKNPEWLKSPVMTEINSGRIQGTSIPTMQINKTNALVSKNGYYKMYINSNNELVIVASIKNANYAYAIIPDYKSNKLFLADTNDENKILVHVPDSYQKSHASYSSYADIYPLKEYESQYTKIINANCEAECTKVGCSYYYDSKTKKGNECYLSNTDSNLVFAPFQSKQNDGLTSSTLYVANKSIITKDNNKDKYPYTSNGYNTLNNNILNYNLASFEYDENTNLTDFIDGQINIKNEINAAFGNNSPHTAKNTTMNIFMTNKFEGFEESNSFTAANAINSIDTTIIPLNNQYNNNQRRVIQNRVDISNTITDISANYYTQANNNEIYDFTGPEINSLKPNRTITTAILKDQDIMLEEHNNLYIVSTITVATLLIASIFIASD